MCDEKADIKEKTEQNISEMNNSESLVEKTEQRILEKEVSYESNKGFFEEEETRRHLFRKHKDKEDTGLSREEWILSKIKSEDIIQYLTLEQQREESIRKAKDIHEKRIITTFQLTVSLAACVTIVYFLKDNPTILVNVMYVGGILGIFWLRKTFRDK